MRTRYSTPLHHRINWTPVHRKDQGTASLCRTINRTVATIHTSCMSRTALRRMYSHARQPRFTSRRPPRINFSHTFNTSLAPCMAKHRSQQQKRPWLFCFRFLLFPRAVRSEASSSGYAAPSAFERHRRCFARDVELIPLSTCHGLSRAQ
jgi:hypothetical protein